MIVPTCGLVLMRLAMKAWQTTHTQLGGLEWSAGINSTDIDPEGLWLALINNEGEESKALDHKMLMLIPVL